MSTNQTARRTALVSIDGAAFIPVPFHLADFATPGDFARDVVAALAWAETGHVVTGIREVGSAAPGAYCGTFNAGRRRIRFAFKSAPSPVGLISGRHLAAALSSTAMVPQQAQQQQGRDMRAGPDADVRRATAEAFRSTDGAWQNALVQQFGRRAADVRYTAAGAGEPGSDLRRLYSDRYRAYKAWAEARGMDAAPDALCEPLPAVHPHYLPALAYETGHVVDDGELTYATPADREACVARALAAGWRLDVLSARLDDWPWYRLAEEGDTSAVQRDGEWRFYVETAAEALAYVGEADHVALVEMAR